MKRLELDDKSITALRYGFLLFCILSVVLTCACVSSTTGNNTSPTPTVSAVKTSAKIATDTPIPAPTYPQGNIPTATPVVTPMVTPTASVIGQVTINGVATNGVLVTCGPGSATTQAYQGQDGVYAISGLPYGVSMPFTASYQGKVYTDSIDPLSTAQQYYQIPTVDINTIASTTSQPTQQPTQQPTANPTPKPTPAPTPTPMPTSAPTVAPTINPTAQPTQPPSSANYFASSGSGGTKFHISGCRYVLQIKPENLLTFTSRQAAVAAGYAPCSICNP